MKIIFTKKEVRDIIIATLVLTIAFKFAFNGIYNANAFVFMIYLLISFLAVVTGFVGHEMMHKATAFRYNYYAEFIKWNTGLLIAFFTSLFGIVFAAPGATTIYGYVDKDTNGKISAAGPIYNIFVGILFLLVSLVSFLHFLIFVAVINFWLGFFNLLPIPPLDGSKIYKWNLPLYIILMGASLILVLQFIFGISVLSLK
ncbi:MAG: site-2 protease family protein [Thermoplasmata archaeon]